VNYVALKNRLQEVALDCLATTGGLSRETPAC